VILVLVHHADAVGPEVDPQRPLSARGRGQAERLAERAKAAGVVPSAIWHSGKLRARQTAEAFYRLCNPFAEFRMVRGLAPDDPPGLIRDALFGEARNLMVVGHMPNIRDLAHLLLPGTDAFPLHGMIVMEREAEGAEWRELWRQTTTDN
jgi:phosphohistidine phosphatase